jgi:hypothetical protein
MKLLKDSKKGKKKMKKGGLDGYGYGFVPDLVKYCKEDTRQSCLMKPKQFSLEGLLHRLAS